MCGKKDHKVMNCIMNPKSDNYVPPYKRRDPNAGPNRPPGKALVASSEGYHHPHTDEAQAMNAMGGELFNLGAMLEHTQRIVFRWSYMSVITLDGRSGCGKRIYVFPGLRP
jgi:hypothetical protein